MPVRLCLAALPGQRLEDIERVYSHIQALGQAEAFLRTRDWSLLAADQHRRRRQDARRPRRAVTGAVLSPRAAGALRPGGSGFRYPVRAGKPDPVPGPRRSRRGRVRGAADPRTAGCTRPSSSRCATSPAPSSGFSAPWPITTSNMSKLESRPSRTRAWEYVFWIDLDADLCCPRPRPRPRRPARRGRRTAGHRLLPEGSRARLSSRMKTDPDRGLPRRARPASDRPRPPTLSAARGHPRRAGRRPVVARLRPGAGRRPSSSAAARTSATTSSRAAGGRSASSSPTRRRMPDFRHASIDLFLAADVHGQGLVPTPSGCSPRISSMSGAIIA